MGNFEEDKEEYLRNLRKARADKQYLDYVETLVAAAPDVAVGCVVGPAVAGAVTAGGGIAGFLIAGPTGMVVGLTAGAVGGVCAGVKAEEAYQSASTEDRARMRALGQKAVEGGMAARGAWKAGRTVLKLLK
ncbi:hypothetical protein [Streptomyces sp. A1547]|uniref:hypothetical protein n=1 Tax=Streptomyces sp. A1547 TaxID=2563105 RepID=UPI00061F9293|nr:hypothetical protein [Streptomyces sp. A1547]KJY48054.1 hypothetical protein VR46_00185 [Streptomyces sp. NRRL S-444]THA28700.1 hypothetical protein E6W17_40520 [Streptomyces sp. A1547]